MIVNFDYRVQMVDDGEEGEVFYGQISMPSADEELAEQRVIDLMYTDNGARKQDILRIDLDLVECEHPDFEETGGPDGGRRCLACGKTDTY